MPLLKVWDISRRKRKAVNADTFGDFVKQGEYFSTSVPDHCKSIMFAGHYYSKLNIHPGILYSCFGPATEINYKATYLPIKHTFFKQYKHKWNQTR